MAYLAFGIGLFNLSFIHIYRLPANGKKKTTSVIKLKKKLKYTAPMANYYILRFLNLGSNELNYSNYRKITRISQMKKLIHR